ncbi:serine hydrolase domain-containing protein [Agromyces sp. ZXT2-6]|uniref:serine hydrolase domain-containing protein n=1 Tax=Agromyces sp. ZXT2-6 TaxID=3461153 RepID=UPI004054B36B
MVTISNDAFTTRTANLLARQPALGLALGLVRDGELTDFRGHGVADPATGAPITPDTVFRIASITKTLTAVAVMQLVEQGRLDLDRPAGDDLRAFRLAPAHPGLHAPTIRHLLTHTAGLGEVARHRDALAKDFGESFPVGRPLPSLAEFYGGELRYHAEPGTRFVYTNHGPATLGQIVEDVTGETLAAYVRSHIFEPLGMTDSTLERAGLTQRLTTRLAAGHELRSRGVVRTQEMDWVTVGAAAAWSTPRDIARYLAALLPGGRAADGTRILSGETVAAMIAPQYTPDPRIPGMGLAFFRSVVAGRVVAGHQGTLPGYHSAVAFAPDDGVAALAFTNGASRPDFWLPAAVHHILGAVLGPPATVAGPAPHHPELWADQRGWYHLDARASDVRLRGMLGAGAQVFVRGGRLMMRFLTPVPALALGFPLVPDDDTDPHAFRIDLPGEDTEPIRVVFRQGPGGVTDRLCCDIMPLVLRRHARRQP